MLKVIESFLQGCCKDSFCEGVCFPTASVPVVLLSLGTSLESGVNQLIQITCLESGILLLYSKRLSRLKAAQSFCIPIVLYKLSLINKVNCSLRKDSYNEN